MEVSIQGESSRTITLTRIRFDVRREPRPDGAIFLNPCGDSVYGRFLRVDLDHRPPAVVATNADPESSDASQRPAKPIRFPWTVSVTDPLTLTINAQTKVCSCTWKALIYWRSGEKTGVLPIDNGGNGYTVVGSEGLQMYSNGNDGFQPR